LKEIFLGRKDEQIEVLLRFLEYDPAKRVTAKVAIELFDR